MQALSKVCLTLERCQELELGRVAAPEDPKKTAQEIFERCNHAAYGSCLSNQSEGDRMDGHRRHRCAGLGPPKKSTKEEDAGEEVFEKIVEK